MWVLLSSRLRTWLLLAVAVPVARRVLRAVAGRGRDDSRASRTLRRADTALARVDRRERKRRRKAQKQTQRS